jgi:hypothetical protein
VRESIGEGKQYNDRQMSCVGITKNQLRSRRPQ